MYGEYRDGGYGGPTNPTIEGYDSILGTSGNDPGMVISLGSGALPYSGRGRAGFLNLFHSVRKLGDDAEGTHAVMKSLEEPYYSRLDVHGLAGMRTDEWKGKHGIDTLKFIREQTEKYLHLDQVKKDIAEAARRLVEARRARASTDHWERFCHGVEYVCTVIGCKDNIHGDRTDLRRHLEDVHQIDSSRIETVLDRGKRFPLYAGKGKDD